jgi:hypothetical protein
MSGSRLENEDVSPKGSASSLTSRCEVRPIALRNLSQTGSQGASQGFQFFRHPSFFLPSLLRCRHPSPPPLPRGGGGAAVPKTNHSRALGMNGTVVPKTNSVPRGLYTFSKKKNKEICLHRLRWRQGRDRAHRGSIRRLVYLLGRAGGV